MDFGIPRLDPSCQYSRTAVEAISGTPISFNYFSHLLNSLTPREDERMTRTGDVVMCQELLVRQVVFSYHFFPVYCCEVMSINKSL